MIKPLEVEYVYSVGQDFEYRKTRVLLQVAEDKVALDIHSEQMMTREELDTMLRDFQSDVLKKRHIQLTSECYVTLTYDGELYQVDLSDNATDDTPLVKGLTPA